jgi:hypothetical protein
LAQGGAALAKATDGFALLPGADKQYGIISTFSQPYNNSFSLTQPFSLPVSSETILVPVGVTVKSDQLNDAGVQNFQGANYHIYQGGILASGSTLSLVFSGKPGGSAPLGLNQQMVLLLSLLAAGLLLIGTGIFLLRRNRSKALQMVSGTETSLPSASVEEDRETIMDAIIALDDQYKGACISKDAYIRRREELKKKLKGLI